MIQTYKQLVASQYEAAFCTLGLCVNRCPDSSWDLRIGSYVFSQVVFHTLFFTDYYLGPNAESLFEQPFHRGHQDVFSGYEQLQDREPVERYQRPFLVSYLAFCRNKAARTVSAESAETLAGASGFERRRFSRAELHVYNIRHIQHHAGQLVLRLRAGAQVEIPWVESGWVEPSVG